MNRNDCYEACIVYQLSIKLIQTIEFLLKLLCVDSVKIEQFTNEFDLFTEIAVHNRLATIDQILNQFTHTNEFCKYQSKSRFTEFD